MDLFYQHKHKKSHPTLIQIKEYKSYLAKQIKLSFEITKLNLKIAELSIKIFLDDFHHRIIKGVDMHDLWWDRYDRWLEEHMYRAKAYSEREWKNWKRYFRSLHNGLD